MMLSGDTMSAYNTAADLPPLPNKTLSASISTEMLSTHSGHPTTKQGGSIRHMDLTKIFKELLTTVELQATQLADDGRLHRHIRDILEGIIARRDELKHYARLMSGKYTSNETLAASGSSDSLNAKNNVNHWFTELYRSAYLLKSELESPVTSTMIYLGLSKKWPKSKKKKVEFLHDDMRAAWQNLLLSLTLCIANTSSGTAKQVSNNLHKLAIASGAPDWEDLTIDDGKALFLRGEKYLMGLGVPKSNDIAYKSYLASAKCGNADGMNMLGVMAETGMGVDKDMSVSLKWFKEAANRGSTEAMNNLGRIYETGKGVGQDTAAASSWYLKAAERGNPDAMVNLGFMLENGVGQDANTVLAVEWYRMSAIQGFARGQNSLGSCYYRGVGVPQDYGEAVMWYKKAADQGNPHAQNNLGICYEEGLGVARDIAMAKTLYKAASDSKHASGTNNLGYMLLLEGNWAEALKLFHLGWALGSADAAYNIGTLYETGCVDASGPVLDQNIEMAIRWYQEAAQLDSVKAQVRLGSLLITGPSPRHHNPELAAVFLERAAAAGSAEARDLLGQILELGLIGTVAGAGEAGVPRLEEAAELYRAAAELGHAGGMFHLAVCFESGIGVPRDYQKALKLFEEAERLGSDEARARLELFREIQML